MEHKLQLIQKNFNNKPTATERHINFNSHQPISISMKKDIVYNLVDTAIQLSHFYFHGKNLLFLESALIKDNYPLYSVYKKNISKKEFVKFSMITIVISIAKVKILKMLLKTRLKIITLTF